MSLQKLITEKELSSKLVQYEQTIQQLCRDKFIQRLNYYDTKYGNALKEITNCAKKSCWIWYILPGNIGYSETAINYILHENEVIGYLDISMLKNNYIEIVKQINKCLHNDISKIKLFGKDIDIKKANTSMRLFRDATNGVNRHKDVHTLCVNTLELMKKTK